MSFSPCLVYLLGFSPRSLRAKEDPFHNDFYGEKLRRAKSSSLCYSLPVMTQAVSFSFLRQGAESQALGAAARPIPRELCELRGVDLLEEPRWGSQGLAANKFSIPRG